MNNHSLFLGICAISAVIALYASFFVGRCVHRHVCRQEKASKATKLIALILPTIITLILSLWLIQTIATKIASS